MSSSPWIDERAVSAQVGDLRDLPARWTVRARLRDASARECQWRRKTNHTVVPASVSTPQRSASRPIRNRPNPPGSSSAPIRGVGREAVAVVADLDPDLVVPGRVQLQRLGAVAVADRVRDDLGDEQPEALDLAVAEFRSDRVADPCPGLGDRLGLGREGSDRACARPSINCVPRPGEAGNRTAGSDPLGMRLNRAS